ncbi:hypothetical protein TNCV_3865231 [Trichonephila clavipes]|nr:hypothetical protein TNCV_3865231 [Trichonephila clavipes]
MNDWRALLKVPGVVLIFSAATTILTTIPSAKSTGSGLTKSTRTPANSGLKHLQIRSLRQSSLVSYAAVHRSLLN